MDEVEAKFTLLDEAVFRQLRQIDRLAGFELGAEQVREVDDTFLDTADRLILAAGYYCRQRQVAGRLGVEMTLKALTGGTGGIRRREELNLALPDTQPPTGWPAGPLRERVLAWIGPAPLQPLFCLQQLRTTRPLLRAGQLVAEISMDQVGLAQGARRTSFHELEVELAPAGTAADLAAVVAALHAGWTLQPQELSKFERGLAFLQSEPDRDLVDHALTDKDGDSPEAVEEARLTDEERTVCRRLARRTDLHGRRARVLLALDAGATQVAAGRQVGMSERRVRYWQATFRQERLGIFPRRVLAPALSPEEQDGRPLAAAEAPTGPPPAAVEAREAAVSPVPAGPPPVAVETREGSPAPAPASLAPAAVLAREAEPPAVPAGLLPGSTAVREAALPPVPAGLAPDDTMAQAARKTVQRHLRQMLEHEPGVRLGTDIEQVHDMRVATRRMRAAMRVFGDYLDPEQARTLTRDLRRAGRLLGMVRDLDVFRAKAQHYLDRLPVEQRGALAPLLVAWEAHYGKSRAALVAYLDGERYLRLQAHMDRFLQGAEQPTETVGTEPRPQRLRQVVPVSLYQALATVRAYEEFLVGPAVPLSHYHGLRIASKGLRYALEFFRDVLGPEATTLVERMKVLQDHLGDLQDAVVACGLLRDFLTWGTWGRPKAAADEWPTMPVLAPGVAAYLAYRQVEIQQLLAAFPPAWEQVRGPEFARLLAASLAALWG